MSHLPEHVETIAKLILDRPCTTSNDEDQEPNDKPASQLKTDRKQAVESDDKPADSFTRKKDSKTDTQLDVIMHQDAIDNFIRAQSRRLKILYPNFTDQEISAAANKFWSELAEDQKVQLCAKFQRNAKLEFEPQIKNAVQEQIPHKQATITANPSANPSQTHSESSQPHDPSLATNMSTQPEQIIATQQTTQQTSPEASTNANVSEDQACPYERIQKYVLVSCKENSNGDETEGDNNVVTVLLSEQKGGSQQQSSVKVVIVESCPSKPTDEQETGMVEMQPQIEPSNKEHENGQTEVTKGGQQIQPSSL